MIRVQAEDFDPGAELAGFAAGNHKVGGICMFLGLVRDFLGAVPDGAPPVTAMTLEHYPGMTEKQLAAIEAQARARWPLEEVLIIHRFGRLEAGDRIVLVAAASAHREAAFEACHFLIDWLKTKAPFWKLEHAEGGDLWVEAKESDDLAAERWAKKT
ncbi:molybdenum cofactor biosynthesis protein MoaE [Magnetospirillum moscoviense]|uniref:Molybdopterin synthase catalytic subunit n=1 Tax=Magnetospirillum moscoviense TaxID=1437059 RepID=A0A178MW07_9PROT|nr:molybdenum cofactor biosynthesis protein MoaE [Magnetospirillum moscoviense]MBF0326501.1 molybdenum cofactor biosynthesis protein MoaE [Alphaproteobacteria bacterium]OAN53227.1 molybdenum cofactor biosynthesis protein MoaE [Magnetospirillum moscoviense]